jgi:hypothetical protein
MMISTGGLAAMEGGGGVFPGGGKTAEIYFGGGRRPSGCLRDLLADRIRSVPAGGSIDWVAYYFRDRRLAGDLLAAHRRGVRVTVTMEKQPRTPHANEAVAEMLAGPQGLGAGFRLLSLPLLLPRLQAGWKPHLHEKLYCFSHPEPVAFLGSYNPSGDQPENVGPFRSFPDGHVCDHRRMIVPDVVNIPRGLMSHLVPQGEREGVIHITTGIYPVGHALTGGIGVIHRTVRTMIECRFSQKFIRKALRIPGEYGRDALTQPFS